MTNAIKYPANVQITNNLEIARGRLSKFVLAQALHITRVTGINYEESNTAPETYEEVLREFTSAKVLNKPVRVFSGASESTIYTSPAANWAFRFWHDYVHYSFKLDFSVQSEILVGERQCAAVAAEFGLGSLEYRLMYTDTIGQVQYYAANNSFVENQLEFAKEQLKIAA
jgi:hypothetical protein